MSILDDIGPIRKWLKGERPLSEVAPNTHKQLYRCAISGMLYRIRLHQIEEAIKKNMRPDFEIWMDFVNFVERLDEECYADMSEHKAIIEQIADALDRYDFTSAKSLVEKLKRLPSRK
jgi:hypothetical protein